MSKSKNSAQKSQTALRVKEIIEKKKAEKERRKLHEEAKVFLRGYIEKIILPQGLVNNELKNAIVATCNKFANEASCVQKTIGFRYCLLL